MNYDCLLFTTAVTILHFVRLQPNSGCFNIFNNICNNMFKCLWCNPPPTSPLLLHSRTMFFSQVQRSKPPQLIDSLLWQHEFLLRTDFTFHVLWQCVPYSPLLTTSSDPVLFCVYFWDQTVVWSGGLPLFLLSRREMKEEHRVTLGGPADGGSHRVSCSLFLNSPNSPNGDANQRKWKGSALQSTGPYRLSE